ncbi:MAG: prepilin-type N-terminal cleavage/methylation domain-containing protein [Nitrospirae bacterium]|nr:prepilin-type N-terminal cleavage/methylation domain-containing protein [Nitrospirota bacterium]
MNRRIIINRRGITLLEIILVMVIMGILAGIIVVPVITGAKAWSDMTRQNEVSQQARIGLDRFVREARAIRRVNGRPSLMVNWTEGVTPVAIGPNRIRFITSSGEDLEYSWAGAGQPLIRTDWTTGVAVTDPAAINVQNFSLAYYEDSNASIVQMRQEAEDAPVACTPDVCADTVQGADVVLAVNGATLAYQFTGTRIAWIGPKDVGLGTAEVWISDTVPDVIANPATTDPATAIVVQNSSAATPATALFVSGPLPYGAHWIAIACRSPLNADCSVTPVKADALDLLVNRVVVDLTVGEGACNANLCTTLRDQISFRSVQ